MFPLCVSLCDNVVFILYLGLGTKTVVRLRKCSGFRFKYLFSSLQTCLEMFRLPVKNKIYNFLEIFVRKQLHLETTPLRQLILKPSRQVLHHQSNNTLKDVKTLCGLWI